MPLVTTALSHLITVLVIGVVAGLAFNRFGRNWLGRHASSATGASDTTSALVGIAGAFIGFHLGVVLELLPTPLMLYLLAIVGAVVTVGLWRAR